MGKPYKPKITDAGLGFSKPAIVIVERREPRENELLGERVLNIYLDFGFAASTKPINHTGSKVVVSQFPKSALTC